MMNTGTLIVNCSPAAADESCNSVAPRSEVNISPCLFLQSCFLHFVFQHMRDEILPTKTEQLTLHQRKKKKNFGNQ